MLTFSFNFKLVPKKKIWLYCLFTTRPIVRSLMFLDLLHFVVEMFPDLSGYLGECNFVISDRNDDYYKNKILVVIDQNYPLNS